MAKSRDKRVEDDLRELITTITGYEGGCDDFNRLERHVLTTVRKSDSMYFLNVREVDTWIDSMAHKFMFHGCSQHADWLRHHYSLYLDRDRRPKADLMPMLNVVKFLLCASRNPTNEFWRHPERFRFVSATPCEVERVDWKSYLNEGIETTSSWHVELDESDTSDLSGDDVVRVSSGGPTSRLIELEPRVLEPVNVREERSRLESQIQHGWYKRAGGCVQEPESRWFEANVGILWHRHLVESVGGLIDIGPLTVISEYKVLREVLWQMWGLHDSVVFTLQGDQLVLRPNVTISSLTTVVFRELVAGFLRYIMVLGKFRSFRDSLTQGTVTYYNYSVIVQTILDPVYRQLLDLEIEVMAQETTFTLLHLQVSLEKVFEPVIYLDKVHDSVILTCPESTITCALTLITRLRALLNTTIDKMENDICITLYLGCLNFYLKMVDTWLVKNYLPDPGDEFIIRCAGSNKFELRCQCKGDGLVQIICDKVLGIGTNTSLLRSLKKYDIFVESAQSIYDEFIDRMLREISRFYGIPEINPTLSDCTPQSDVSKLGDYVDLSADPFLTSIFEQLHPEPVKDHKPLSLYDKVRSLTRNLYPMHKTPEKILSDILKERFTISGLLVKNLLIDKYDLGKHFVLLRHIYIFQDDLIFPFYIKFLQSMTVANSNWGNSVWLTSHLQDILMDLYPKYYEQCTVQVKDIWKKCRNSFHACSLIKFNYEVKWPVSIVITAEQLTVYQELFQFVLAIKWALYTLNHLSFTDLEPSGRSSGHLTTTIKRLKLLRFSFINLFNTLQHYLFGMIVSRQLSEFELDLEKANDLRSLIRSHENFLDSLKASCEILQNGGGDGDYSFDSMMGCILKLKYMWNHKENATLSNLQNCKDGYEKSFKAIDSIVNPSYLY